MCLREGANMFLRVLKFLFVVVRNLFDMDKKKPDIKWVEINKNEKGEYEAYEIPRIIWIYWDSVDRPTFVNICISQVRKKCPEFDIILLNKNNVLNYIELPLLDESLPKALVADLIRLKLLERYGGVWMDASIFLNESLQWILSRLNGQDAFLFYSDECTADIEHPISENWLIVSPKKSKFIHAWLREYESCITSNDPVSYYSAIKENKGLMQNLTKPDYLLCYISAIMVLSNSKFNILYASSATVGHFFNYKYRFDGNSVAVDMLLKNRKRIFVPKLIKFTSGTRNAMEKYIEKGFYTKRSLIGGVVSSLKDIAR